MIGAKRNPIWGLPGRATSGKTTKGFTGHEEDEEFGLVNMRGRLYDPRIARFTTPDPIIANIFDGQSLNSFSYVWNNPLSFVDPSGFIPQESTMNGQDSRAITPEEFVYQVLSSLQDETPSDPNAAGIGAAASSADTATTGASGAITKSQEGFGSFVEGLVKGNLSDNDSWSATAGSVVGGLIPGIGLAADIRDLGAAVGHIADGKEGAWLEMGAAVIGFVPGGDIAKGIAKGVTKASTKVATKVGVELVDDAARVIKGSTATAADGLTSAQKTAGKVNAPRGPPSASPPDVIISESRFPETAKHIVNAQTAGAPSTLTIGRPGATTRRRDSLRGTTRQSGLDRDEYPPAMFKEGGKGASIRPISPSDNRGAGACMSAQCRGLPDGTKATIKVTK